MSPGLPSSPDPDPDLEPEPEESEAPEEPEEPEEPEQPEQSEEPERRRRLTYRERKAQSDALAMLARTLVELTPSELAEVALPPEVRAEIEICRGFRKSPRIRQLRRISQLLRRLDVEAVTAAADDAGHRQRRRTQRERIYEHWRQRLLCEGNGALAELVDLHPTVDAQRLRQLLRQAHRDPEGARGKQARRSVLRLVREVMEPHDREQPR